MPALPTPRTTTDELLLAVHDELVGLRADLEAARGGEAPPAQPASGHVELREPRPRKTARST